MVAKTRDQPTYQDQVLQLARKGVVQTRAVKALGIPPVVLTRMVRRGLIERVGRGLYRLADGDLSELSTIAEVCTRVPHGVVCLLSALQIHGLGTQMPTEVWLMVDRAKWTPRIAYPPLRWIRSSGEALEHGVEERAVDGVAVRLTNPAKTVADCFKFRNKIGLDVAIEALRDYVSESGSRDDLWEAAKVCRVTRVIRPYLEATT